MNKSLEYSLSKPDKSLSDFVACYWSLQNHSNEELEGVVIPTGNVDLFFSKDEKGTVDVRLIGLETEPKPKSPSPYLLSVVSFRPLAVEYVFRRSIADISNRSKSLPNDFWNFHADDLNDFKAFCEKASKTIKSLLREEIDERKRKLFELIFASDGAISVKELSDKVYWSTRQINRYFTQQFGLSLKTYCNIVRFRASFQQIKQGDLFPQKSFTDQSHFIKASKKLASVSPKELYKNRTTDLYNFQFFPRNRFTA